MSTSLLVLLLALPLLITVQSRFALTGTVLSAQTDEPVAGASVLLLDTGIGTVTDSVGGFSLLLPKGNQTIQVSGQGFETQQRPVTTRADLSLQFRLTERITLLRETIRNRQPGKNISSNNVGVTMLADRALK